MCLAPVHLAARCIYLIPVPRRNAPPAARLARPFQPPRQLQLHAAPGPASQDHPDTSMFAAPAPAATSGPDRARQGSQPSPMKPSLSSRRQAAGSTAPTEPRLQLSLGTLTAPNPPASSSLAAQQAAATEPAVTQQLRSPPAESSSQPARAALVPAMLPPGSLPSAATQASRGPPGGSSPAASAPAGTPSQGQERVPLAPERGLSDSTLPAQASDMPRDVLSTGSGHQAASPAQDARQPGQAAQASPFSDVEIVLDGSDASLGGISPAPARPDVIIHPEHGQPSHDGQAGVVVAGKGPSAQAADSPLLPLMDTAASAEQDLRQGGNPDPGHDGHVSALAAAAGHVITARDEPPHPKQADQLASTAGKDGPSSPLPSSTSGTCHGTARLNTWQCLQLAWAILPSPDELLPCMSGPVQRCSHQPAVGSSGGSCSAGLAPWFPAFCAWTLMSWFTERRSWDEAAGHGAGSPPIWALAAGHAEAYAAGQRDRLAQDSPPGAHEPPGPQQQAMLRPPALAAAGPALQPGPTQAGGSGAGVTAQHPASQQPEVPSTSGQGALVSAWDPFRLVMQLYADRVALQCASYTRLHHACCVVSAFSCVLDWCWAVPLSPRSCSLVRSLQA